MFIYVYNMGIEDRDYMRTDMEEKRGKKPSLLKRIKFWFHLNFRRSKEKEEKK